MGFSLSTSAATAGTQKPGLFKFFKRIRVGAWHVAGMDGHCLFWKGPPSTCDSALRHQNTGSRKREVTRTFLVTTFALAVFYEECSWGSRSLVDRAWEQEGPCPWTGQAWLASCTGARGEGQAPGLCAVPLSRCLWAPAGYVSPAAVTSANFLNFISTFHK